MHIDYRATLLRGSSGLHASGRGRVKTRRGISSEEQRASRSSQDRFSRPRQGSEDPGNSPSDEFSHSLGHLRVLFFAEAEAAAGADLPQFMKDEFDAFLECDILAG